MWHRSVTMTTYRIRKTRSFVFLEIKRMFLFIPYWEWINCTAFENVNGALNFAKKLCKPREKIKVVIIEEQ